MAYKRFVINDQEARNHGFCNAVNIANQHNSSPNLVNKVIFAFQLAQLNAPSDQADVEIAGIKIRCDHIRTLKNLKTGIMSSGYIHQSDVNSILSLINNHESEINSVLKGYADQKSFRVFNQATDGGGSQSQYAIAPVTNAFLKRKISDTHIKVNDVSIPIADIKITVDAYHRIVTVHADTPDLEIKIKKIASFEQAKLRKENKEQLPAARLAPTTPLTALLVAQNCGIDLVAANQLLAAVSKAYGSMRLQIRKPEAIAIPFTWQGMEKTRIVTKSGTLAIPLKYILVDKGNVEISSAALPSLQQFFGRQPSGPKMEL